MGWLQLPGTNKIDEHNEPTEPLPRLDEIPTTPMQNNVVLPAPHPSEKSFPQQPAPANPGQPYPYIPPPVTQQGPQPQHEIGEKVKAVDTGQKTRGKRSLKPLLPGFFFIVVQILLLLRFLLKITGLMVDQWWVGVVFGVSEILVSPFRTLWLQVPLQLPAQIELYTLLAVVVYGLVSRLLVRLLKIVLRSH